VLPQVPVAWLEPVADAATGENNRLVNTNAAINAVKNFFIESSNQKISADLTIKYDEMVTREEGRECNYQ
jgi:hypothetical protein